ncbi:MAG: hypothetical protein LIO62_04000 [Clostridiales bacterium]|nr:hypothetical protein [Clostridiales bacterium]
MKLNKELCALIADIEEIIGSECYNPNSYDGWNDVEGCEFRYPVNIRKQSGEFAKVRTNIHTASLLSDEDITPEAVKYIKYKFGSNELFIGLGIIKTLEFLEKTYGLDFNELVENK